MAWEIIGDFKRVPGLDAEAERWIPLTTALVVKLDALEPLLRFRIRSIPAPGKPQNVFLPVAQFEVTKALHHRLDTPEARVRWVRQYFCHTDGCRSPEGKPKWVPQMWLAQHKGHELTRSEPTGKVRDDKWEPNYRLFIGPPSRLQGLQGIMYSVALTTPPTDARVLDGYGSVLLLPARGSIDPTVPFEVKRLSFAEDVQILPGNPSEAVQTLRDFMIRTDAHALDSAADENDPNAEKKELDKIEARVKAAQRYAVGKLLEKAPVAAPAPGTK